MTATDTSNFQSGAVLNPAQELTALPAVVLPTGDDLAEERLAYRIEELLQPLLEAWRVRLEDQGFVQTVWAACGHGNDGIRLNVLGRHVWRHPEGDATFMAAITVYCFVSSPANHDWSGATVMVELMNEVLNNGQTPRVREGLLHGKFIRVSKALPSPDLDRTTATTFAFLGDALDSLTPEWTAPLLDEAMTKLQEATAT